jgi:tRNA 2-thiouridine synthesizing protein D
MARKTLTLSIMDPPFESANTTTALRIADAALRKGHNVNVFAYEGAVAYTHAKQAAHPNPVKNKTVEDADHPVPKKAVENLFKAAAASGAKLDWVLCGLCLDERGAVDQIEGPRRGSPADLAAFVQGSDRTLHIPSR